MQHAVSKQWMILLMVLGILGAILMASSDWIMIYGDPSYEGALVWLTIGVTKIDPSLNALSLLLAFPAIILYAIALLGMNHFIKYDHHKKVYTVLTTIGLVPWLALHLFYIMILFLFAFLFNSNQVDIAYFASEALFNHFAWLIIVSEIIMILPFLYLFYLILRNDTIFKPWQSINNPIFIFIILKGLTMLLSDSPSKLAFTNGLMSESMIICFIIFIIYIIKNNNRRYN